MSVLCLQLDYEGEGRGCQRPFACSPRALITLCYASRDIVVLLFAS